MVNGPSGTTDLVQSDGPTATMPYLDGWFLNQSKRQYQPLDLWYPSVVDPLKHYCLITKVTLSPPAAYGFIELWEDGMKIKANNR
jgi:hypothetical protein